MTEEQGPTPEPGYAYFEKRNADTFLGIAFPPVDVTMPSHEASFWWVEHRDGGISLIFDQMAAPGRVRERLEIRMAYEPFLTFLSALKNESFATAFRSYLEKFRKITSVPSEHPSRETQCDIHREYRAQAIQMTHIASEAEAVLYRMSATEISKVVRSDKSARIPIAALCRVTGPTRAMARFFADCTRLEAEVREALSDGDE